MQPYTIVQLELILTALNQQRSRIQVSLERSRKRASDHRQAARHADFMVEKLRSERSQGQVDMLAMVMDKVATDIDNMM